VFLANKQLNKICILADAQVIIFANEGIFISLTNAEIFF